MSRSHETGWNGNHNVGEGRGRCHEFGSGRKARDGLGDREATNSLKDGLIRFIEDRVPTGLAEFEVQEARPWIGFRGPRPIPSQGWKLHVSTIPRSYIALLHACLPILVDSGATFKLCASVSTLALLNEGGGGFSQVGKAVTVYPSDSAHARFLAERLHEATAGMGGPVVPSDFAFRPPSAVFYRYGAFVRRPVRLSTGEIVNAVQGPNGALEPDRRVPKVPEWVDDVFGAEGQQGPRYPHVPERTRRSSGPSRPQAGEHDCA